MMRVWIQNGGNSEIPALEEETTKELWQEVRKHKENEKEIDTSAPISIVGQTDYMGMDKLSLTSDELRGETDGDSKPTLWQRYHPT